VPQDVIEILDAGRTFNGGRPPETIRFNGQDLANPRKSSPAQSMLGVAQKKWFVTQLRESKTTWKLWGNSVGMLGWRLDFQNLPNELGVRWPATGYASISSDDWSTCSVERSEIMNLIRREGITGLVTVAGDRHSFQAGLLSESLPPKRFEPVAVEFVTGSVSAPTLFEGASYNLPKDHPLRSVYLYKPADGSAVQPAINLSLMHGVKSGLEMQKSGDLRKALAESNPEVAPHLSFTDLSGHGYAVVRAVSDALDVEFVCIRRPVERSEGPDGGPLAYRVSHRVKMWSRGEKPRLEKKVIEGTPPLIA
jgi:alkaline phosphatase D